MTSPAPDEWVLLAYRIPREPSTPRISVWRKLRRLGAVQLLDGLVGLPAEARTKEHLEWIADEVAAAGGEANLWLARPATKAQQRSLRQQVSADVRGEYDAIIQAASEARRDAPGSRKRTVARLRRDLKSATGRDHFAVGGHERVLAAIRALETAADLPETAR